MSDSSSAIDDLVAKQAITEVIYTYCRALDRMDLELAHTVWHPDGTADYGVSMFQGTGAGFIDWVWVQHAGMFSHSHQITNILIDIDVDGDRAGSEAYVTAALRLPADGDQAVEILSRGRYVDTWSRRGGRWAIDHRRYAEDFTSTYPVTPMEATDAALRVARRDRDDPSYAALGT
jgi:ketosteroid isomerase-like protein